MSDSEEPPGGSTGQTNAEVKAKPLSYILNGTLKTLNNEYFQEFKYFLKDSTVIGEDFEVIKECRLEDRTRIEVMQVMMDTYGLHTIEVMKNVLRAIQHNQALDELCKYKFHPREIFTKCTKTMKSELRKRFRFLSEGVFSEALELNEGYTDLFITEGGSGQVNQEHEVLQMEKHSRKSGQERTVRCQEIFKGLTKTGDHIRTVLTKGVAGVGKTVLTQKFTLDWAEGSANQDVQLLFPFAFRELNKFRGKEFSLVELLHHCFKESKVLFSFQGLQLLFILDGLDECRLQLDFRRTRVITEPTERATVEELLVNLIRGDLLPSARIWITTRPAAANQIPEECVSMVTEVRGFTNEQKEQYFMKRFREEKEVDKIISHIKNKRSLYIMCRIPIFCKILSDVLNHLMKTTETVDLPTTLTQMYIHYLVVQVKVMNYKYYGQNMKANPWNSETVAMVWSWGKLAFEQLLKGNLIFYESDLSECGLEPAEVACYSVFTEVFREEPGQGEDRVYCFIHLTVQEFLAAFHVHQTFFSSGENLLSSQRCHQSPDPEKSLLSTPHSSQSPDFESKPTPEEAFYRCAVDRALESPNGHLDLFLRFLLGLSLDSNQKLLKGLIKEGESGDINSYISQRQNDGLSADKNLNLLHCRNELWDGRLVASTEFFLQEVGGEEISSTAHWSEYAFYLLSSNSNPEEFYLRRFGSSESALLGLLLLVKASTKAILSWCNLSPRCCDLLASVFSSSSLKHLDVSNNDLQDSGVDVLCERLAQEGTDSAPCRLETLSLAWCNLTSRCCGSLASVLDSSSLKHLDLSNNDLGDTGVEQLCAALEGTRVETLSLSGCRVTEQGGASLATTLGSAHSHLRVLDLRYNHLGPSRERLSGLQELRGPLQTLRLDPFGERFMVPGLKKYSCDFSLDPNTAQRNLLLSEDKRSVRWVKETQPHTYHKDRFSKYFQVLSSTGLTGCCYWEVDVSGSCAIAVCYRGIRRDSGFGESEMSWSLNLEDYFSSSLYVANYSYRDTIHLSGVSVRVGVFLDSEAHLSFYEVRSNGNLRHLYTYERSFTEPVFPGIGLYSSGGSGSSVSLVDLKM